MIHNSKVLIIGAKGTLGQELVRVVSAGHEVVGWDKDEIDITEAKSVRRKVQNLKPDILINAAAYNDVDGAEKEIELANQVNGLAVGNLAKVAKELGIPIVHFSTEYVFDGEKENGYKEDDKPNPISAYGRSKYLGEQELQKNTEKFYLIRLSRLFGRTHPNPLFEKERGSPLFSKEGQGGVQRKLSFVQKMLELAQIKSEIEAVDDELSSPTFAPDLAKQTKYIIEQKPPFGIYHATNSGACTWYGFAKAIFEIAKINVKLISVPSSRFPRAAKRPKFGILLNTKFPPMRPWQEALHEYLNQESRIMK